MTKYISIQRISMQVGRVAVNMYRLRCKMKTHMSHFEHLRYRIL